ncbi:Yip1 family protein [Niallia sp. Krafla_26]|uniref:Yip1 family protein n=1 Tax=Niallia sp. Krafla_26 TaxID=3064703 RepID=UPI003D185EC1
MKKNEQSQKPNLWGILWHPREQLLKIRQNSLIAFPLIVVTILYVVASTLEALSIRTEDIRLSGMSLQEAEMVSANAKAFTAMSGFITPIFSITALTFLYYIIVKIAKKDVPFKNLFSMNTYLFVIVAVGLLFNSLLWMILDNPLSGKFVTSLGGILKSDFTPLYSIELFSIWHYIVTGIGLYTIGQLSKKASIFFVIILFILELFLSFLGTEIFNLIANQ